MKLEDKKILLTGVCYVHRLLEQRFRKPKVNYIEAIHPHFDVNKVNFFRQGIEDRFLFTDFHGRISSIKTEANNLPELLSVYEPLCEKMYVVGATQIVNLDVPNIMPEDYRKVSAFWYFLFNQDWNPTETRNWEAKRDQVLLALLNRFPTLKFIFYQDCCTEWWKNNNLPSSRMIRWHIDWGISNSDYQDIKRDMEAKGIRGGHRFPNESSYSELCDLILKDMRC